MLFLSSEDSTPNSFKHPTEQITPAELKAYLEGFNPRMFCHPPNQEGYPGQIRGEWIMRNYMGDLFHRIIHTVGMPENELKLYVEPILVNFSELVHMLPATENHHHYGPCGLLRHRLDVASLALDACLIEKWDSDMTPAQRCKRRPRWYVAGIAAGLLYNSYKPFSDMRITDLNGENQWSFVSGTIHNWSKKLNLDHYSVDWSPSHQHRHEPLALTISGLTIPWEVNGWLMEGNDDIHATMLDAIAGRGNSRLTEIVLWANSTSIDCDILCDPSSMNSSGSGTKG